ncbi:MAG: hypothetical protein II847_09855 [Ruminobacter sp.]|jgi:FtsZ-interacting cell division protein ZipA|uniref:Cell division protein ZipA n=1 Tax=Ruminobacter amylophilus TaxID=867 RepID=A0A662ZFS7_9GAMM|nr:MULTISPECIES: cell division protein ZipA C-terminal FtsZ-binding domain-containing protein [Ruminobacter]MBQ3776409.1 hypothetical protein [Ruminobacter sp.]SFP00544.1 Cell division protein ZipA, interacts with FtsZ [Ruminobacter amylophilus]
MDLQVLVIILGALAIVAFIVHGFVMGRVDRRPLVRDRMAESNAKAKTPTSNDMGQVQGSVKIIDKDVINVDNKEFIDNAEDVVLSKDDADMNQNTQNQKEDSFENEQQNINSMEAVDSPADQKAESDTKQEVDNDMSDNNSIVSSWWKKFCGLFTGSKKDGKNAENDMEPLSVYQINVRRKDGQPISATTAVKICENCGLVLGEHDIYYFFDKNNPNNEVFRVCGGKDPYGFAKSYQESVSYEVLCLFMPLPERGFAEDAYLQMASFAYRFAHQIDGEMIDNNKRAIGESFVLHHREVLAAYDRLK